MTKQEAQKQALAMVKRDVVDVVAERVNQLTGSGELHLPENYSAQNAMKAAWLALQTVEDKNHNKALAVCSNDSVANALLDMVVQGLNPSKDQCYFVVFGKQLVLMRGYFGTIALYRRIYGPHARVFARVVYDGDGFEYSLLHGRIAINQHTQKLVDVDDSKMVGAYAVAEPGGEHEPEVEIMRIEQIRVAWQQGQAKGKSPAHEKFGGEMAKKTVINRVLKRLINASDDAYLKTAIERQATLATDAIVEGEMLEATEGAEVLEIPAETEGEGDFGLTDAEKAEIEAGERAEGETPSQQFENLIDDHGLDASKARRVAASLVGLDDVRKLGNVALAHLLSNVDGFIAAYNAEAPAPAQASLDGPEF